MTNRFLAIQFILFEYILLDGFQYLQLIARFISYEGNFDTIIFEFNLLILTTILGLDQLSLN